MHPMLQIPEILLNIFCHITPSDISFAARRGANRDLATLARTCRAFKEPALDILWSELNGPSPLSCCLPEISHSVVMRESSTTFYWFTRPLEQAEWDILRSYTRRVWCIRDPLYYPKLDWSFLEDFIPSAVDPLFPNLRSLDCIFTKKIGPFLRLPFPSLIQLNICLLREHVDSFGMLQDSLMSIVKTSPKIRIFEIGHWTGVPGLCEIVSNSICGWSNLHTITCPNVALNVDALVHLSHMPTLTQLTCGLSNAILHETAPSHSLSNWNSVKLQVESLAPVSRLLSWVQLPAITTFSVAVWRCPSKEELALFMADIQISGMGQTIQKFNLQQDCMPPEAVLPHPDRDPDAPLLELNDLWSCTSFHNLRFMNIDLDWNVHLSDDQLLMLGSAWPRLEELCVNAYCGWNSPGGITPIGLAQLLETCPFLMSIALAIDTRGFTRPQARPFQKRVNFSSFEGPFIINVIDSDIKEESMDAMAAFFCGIAPHFHFVLTSWDGWTLSGEDSEPDSDCHPYRVRWRSVYKRADELIRKKWLSVLQQLIFQPRPRV